MVLMLGKDFFLINQIKIYESQKPMVNNNVEKGKSVCVRVCACVCVCMRVYTCVCMCAFVCTHTCVY